MAQVEGRLLQITRDGILLEVAGKKPWFPRGSVQLRAGRLVRGEIVKLSLSRRLKEKKLEGKDRTQRRKDAEI